MQQVELNLIIKPRNLDHINHLINFTSLVHLTSQSFPKAYQLAISFASIYLSR